MYKKADEVIRQFLSLLDYFSIDKSKVEATYLNSTTFGTGKGRDKLLEKKYTFPEDKESKKILEQNLIKTYPVQSIQNIDIHPVEGALVGSRVEIAYNGIEIATIVFDCFKIHNKKLVPINYVGGYAMGIERLALAISNKKDLMEVNPKHLEKLNEIVRKMPAIKSSLFNQERYIIIYGLDVLETIRGINILSDGQKKILDNFRKTFKNASDKLGMQN